MEPCVLILGTPLPPPAPDQSQLLLPASQCQPLFRKCQVISDLSANTLLVSVMLMGSQMCAVCQKAQGRSYQGLAQEQTTQPQLRPGWGPARVASLGVSDQPGDIGSFLLDIPGPLPQTQV